MPDPKFPHLPSDYAIFTPSSDDLRPDPPVAALAAALHATHHHITIANGQPSPDFDGEFASAILGERCVFLPEGLGLMRSNAEGLIAVGKQLVCAEAEIVRLRAAADGIPLLLADITERDTTIATLRAALGTARLELMQDVDPDAIVAGIDCALTP